MRTSQPQTIYLSDYKVPAYLVDHVDLRFELFEDGARVHSTLALRRNPDIDPRRSCATGTLTATA